MEFDTTVEYAKSDEQRQISDISEDCLLYSFVVYTIFVGILCIIGIAGNLISFLVFRKDRSQNSTSYLFQGLSLIDSSLLLLVLPLYSVDAMVAYTGWFKAYTDYVDPWVKVCVFPLALMNQTATIWTTVLVGVNRYISVCKPFKAPILCTIDHVRKQLAIVIVCAVLYNLPKCFEARVERVTNITPTGNYTTFQPAYTSLGKEYYYWIIYGNMCYLIFMLVLPIFILSVLNIRLIKTLRAQKRKRSEMQTQIKRHDNSVTYLLIVIILVFIIAQTPAMVNQILWNVFSDEYRQCHGFQFYFSRISNALVIANSAVNFPIYFRFNKRFRHVLLSVVCKRGLSNHGGKFNESQLTSRTSGNMI